LEQTFSPAARKFAFFQSAHLFPVFGFASYQA
jgi:hypothetical protein